VVAYSGMFNLAPHISHTWSGVNGIALVNQIQILFFPLNKITIVIEMGKVPVHGLWSQGL
jgi:hypothetical protein